MLRRSTCVAAVLLGLASLPVLAQNDPPSKQAIKMPGDCGNAAAAESPSTNPAPASADGTAPGNAGTSGWSGGLGGSYLGTVPAGSTPESKTWQPATARGLDPLASPPPAPKAC